MASDKGTNRDQTQDRQKSGAGTNQGQSMKQGSGTRSDSGLHRGSEMSQGTGTSRNPDSGTGTGQDRSGQEQPRDSQGQFTGGEQTSGSKPGQGSQHGSKGPNQGSNR